MKTISMVCLAGFGVLAFGCGAPSTDEGEIAGDLELAEFEQALSNNESCDTITAHRTTTGDFATFTTTSNYDPGGCHDGYLIDANDYVGLHPGTFHFLSHSEAPTTAAECAKQRVGLYVWKRNSDGSTTFVGSKWIWGTWGNNVCANFIRPSMDFGIGLGGGTTDYRFAITARTHVTAGDTNGPYTRKAIKSFWFPN